jgi:DNA-binding NtrC family response regulator
MPSGRSIAEALSREPVDAVVLDATESHDGEGELHERLGSRRVPVVMISGSPAAMIAAEARHLQLLRKPFRMNELYEALQAALASGSFGQRKL